MTSSSHFSEAAASSTPGPADGRQPRSGCGAAIVQEGRIMLLQRLRDPEAGCWGLPGGKIDWMETVEHAIRREVEEELGIELGTTTLLCVVDHFEPELGQHWISPVHLATDFTGEPQLREPEKHAAFAWFALDSLPTELTSSTTAALAALAARAPHAL
ncbi:NUDIX hydrolase [Plantibacter sp. Mn2098]|uniref:NUDIX hydrolase n=1 Tax=Plantibacter sp. Mn2098 TaxID=3395266 RepID=UPI003BD5C0E8